MNRVYRSLAFIRYHTLMDAIEKKYFPKAFRRKQLENMSPRERGAAMTKGILKKVKKEVEKW